ncbi:MAG TPA: TIGR03435 family protein [Bryobacteraceae bacterium]|jgi:uncharacterized protein (TIGR03435 family)
MFARLSPGCLLPALCFAAVTFGQSFEAAAIKPNDSGSSHSGEHSDKGLVRIDNDSLNQLIQEAYRVQDYAISAPAWLNDARFDIVAKIPEGVRSDGIPVMLQALLAERFGLKMHHEPKSISGYALVPGKKPPELHEPPPNAGSSSNSNNSKMQGTNISMDKLADMLTRQVREPVQNQTGLKGVFDMKLEWTINPDDPADTRTALLTALQEQLGLKLEARKITIDAVVVDHIERVPTEN